MVAQQAMPASKDAREAPEVAPDADIPFVPWRHLAVLNASYRRRRALRATLAGQPVTIATTTPTRGGDDVTGAIDLPFALGLRTAAATLAAGDLERLALDDVVLADVE